MRQNNSINSIKYINEICYLIRVFIEISYSISISLCSESKLNIKIAYYIYKSISK